MLIRKEDNLKLIKSIEKNESIIKIRYDTLIIKY